MFKKKKWKQLFKNHQLNKFNDLWNKKYEWFEAPNEGKYKDSWSGVSKITIGESNFFLKKQHNYRKPSIFHPLGENLAKKEFKNIKLFNKLGIPALNSIYFKKKKINGKECAILITKSLKKYKSLSDLYELNENNPLNLNIRRKVLFHSAELIKLAHDKKVKIQSLYPKHVFIHQKVFLKGELPKSAPPARFIDLERAKRVINPKNAALRDLETFNRRSKKASKSDRLYFLLVYLGEDKVNERVRKFIQLIEQNSKTK